MRKAMNLALLPSIASEAAARLEADESQLAMFAWPQVFGSTSGPHGGIGGAAMTSFQVVAFEAPDGQAIKWCDGVWKAWDGKQNW